jgi:biotin operon repressor
MSKHVVSLVYSRKAGSLLRKAVLAYMADVANHDGTGVWSSKQRIADEIEASKKGVRECIKSLVADGILSEVGQRKCMNGYTIEYVINLDVVSALEPMPHQKGEGGINTPVTPGDLTGELDSPDGGTEFPQTVLNRPKPKPSPKKTRERISRDWQPDDTLKAYALAQGIHESRLAECVEDFADYFSSPNSKLYTDYAQVWRGHCRRNSQKFSQPKEARNGYRTRNFRPGQRQHTADTSAFIRGIEEAADILDHAALSGRDGQEFHPARSHPASAHERGDPITIDVDSHVVTAKLAS